MRARLLSSFPPDLRRLVPYAALLAWCAVLIAVRIERTGSLLYAFLAGNLFLAGIPLALSTGVRRVHRGGGGRWWLLAPLLAMWLVFLPNAPYILTDLLHLGPKPPAPIWYDLVLLLSAAGTGLALGYRSLLDVEGVLAERFGYHAGLSVTVAVLFLSGFGIYLGRFLRLNSWDVATDPLGVLGLVMQHLLDPLAHDQAWVISALFGTLLTLGYLVVRPHARGTQQVAT